MDEVLHKKKLLYVLKIVKSKLFSRYHDDVFAEQLEINRSKELIT